MEIINKSYTPTYSTDNFDNWFYSNLSKKIKIVDHVHIKIDKIRAFNELYYFIQQYVDAFAEPLYKINGKYLSKKYNKKYGLLKAFYNKIDKLLKELASIVLHVSKGMTWRELSFIQENKRVISNCTHDLLLSQRVLQVILYRLKLQKYKYKIHKQLKNIKYIEEEKEKKEELQEVYAVVDNINKQHIRFFYK